MSNDHAKDIAIVKQGLNRLHGKVHSQHVSSFIPTWRFWWYKPQKNDTNAAEPLFRVVEREKETPKEGMGES